MKTFTYTTKTQGNKKVILFEKKIHGNYLVEVNPDWGMADNQRSYKYDNIMGAIKKFESIKKRVSHNIIK